MKHLFITDEYTSSSGNGIGTYIRQLITSLSGLDISIGILVFNSNLDIFSIEETNGIRYFHFPTFPDKSIQNHFRIINKFLRLYIPDTDDNFFMINYFPCSLFMKIIRESHPLSRQIYVIHDMAWTLHLFGDVDQYIRILKQKNIEKITEQYSHLFTAYKEEIEMCRYADQVVCLSEDTYQLLEKHYLVDLDKLRLIPNTLFNQFPPWSEIQKRDLKKKMFLQEDDKILLYVGRMTEHKGFMVYIEAFEEIVKAYPTCRLIVAGGSGNWESIIKISYPVLAKIHFTGFISADELEKWYQMADIGILPSYTEQCSYVGLEMMAHGISVVASDGFGVRCMFRQGMNARIAHIGRWECLKEFKKELVNSTLELLYAPIEPKKGSKDAINYLQTNYSTNMICRLYRELFNL